MRESPPILSWLKVNSIGNQVAVAGQLDRVPSEGWQLAFKQVVALAGFDVHPRLEGDVVLATAEPSELIQANYAVNAAILMATDAYQSTSLWNAPAANAVP